MTSLLRKRNANRRPPPSFFSLVGGGGNHGDNSKSPPRHALPALIGLATLLIVVSLTANVYAWFWMPRASLSTSEERECGFLLAQQQQQQQQQQLKNATLFPWEQSTTMPMWMKYYIFWHTKQRRALTPENWNKAQQPGYYILHCLQMDQKIACGGASDRLQQVPYALRVAYDTNRLLFIKWEKPAPLEAFLEPPPGGLDWRLPKWLDERLPWDDYYNYAQTNTNNRGRWWSSNTNNPQQLLLTGHVGPAGGMTQGAEEYDALKAPHEAPYHIMFHDCWQALFRPIPPIQTMIDDKLQELGLQAGHYVSVHIRAKYLEDHSQATDFIQNAVQCGHALRRDQPIFVASDSTDVLKEALCFYEQQKQKQPPNDNNNQVAMRGSGTDTITSHSVPRLVVSRHGNCSRAQRPEFRVADPLHFDNGADFFCTSCAHVATAQPQDYYDTFVELYLLAGGGCVAAGRGGYGVWASRISRNASCLLFHAEQDPGSGSRYFREAVTCPAG